MERPRVTSHPKALIVDDNEVNVTVLRCALETLDVPFDIAMSGPEALERLQSGRYAVVLLDYHMPDMDGAEVLDWMNANLDERPAVIVVTADARNEIRLKFEALGCDGFVTKPISLSVLVPALSPVMNKKIRDDARRTS